MIKSETLLVEEAFPLEQSYLSISANPDIHQVKPTMKAMEETLPSYSQECCTETARPETPALLLKTSQLARARPGQKKRGYDLIVLIQHMNIKSRI